MQVEEDMILIAASDSGGEGLTKGAGSFYGTETLLQMLDIEQRGTTPINCPGGVTYLPNKVVAPACYIYDYPEMVWRGQMSDIGGGLPDPQENPYPQWDIYKTTGFDQDSDNDVTANKKLFAQQMAKFKMNRLALFSTIFFFLNCDVPYSPIDGWKNYDYLESLFNYCRKLHIEPIPMLGDWSNALLRHNGNCLECSIFDSDYIEQNNLRPGEGDYPQSKDYYRNYEDYPYPMPQPSWEFIVGNAINNYFADNQVEVWDEDNQEYVLVDSDCYRVYDDISCPIKVEVWNEGQEKWDPLDPLTNLYTLHNVGLNYGDTSYYRFMYAGFYGDEQEYWAYITFDPSLNGKKVRVSYAAPINMSLILPNSFWASSNPLSQRFCMYTCLSDFDQNPHPNPPTDDIPDNWTTWDSRDIWYVALYEMIDWLKPRYIDIQHCEMWVMHTDKRCREERKTTEYSNAEIYPSDMRVWEHNAFNYGKEINWLNNTIITLDSTLHTNTQMMLYADMLDSHNGHYGEGRCWWNWYPNETPILEHQPDADYSWIGNAKSHIYYQPAMGGMGGWTWDERDEPNGLHPCNYGMMASDYITQKDSIVCREWGYQAGYFDDRDPEHVITWQDKFKERLDNLKDQGFTNFVGDCAGYALALEGGGWGVKMRCEDYVDEHFYPQDLEKTGSSSQVDGTNMSWERINGELSLDEQDGIYERLFVESSTLDPAYGGRGHPYSHFVLNTGKGCHIGTVENGIAYIDDVYIEEGGEPLDIENLGFEDGLLHWELVNPIYVGWESNEDEHHNGDKCCKVTIKRRLFNHDNEYIAQVSQNYQEGPFNLRTINLKFNAYIKPLKLDALRHLNVKTWMDLTYNYQPQDNILGVIDTVWGEKRNYSSEPTSADWMWSKNYPSAPFLAQMFYDPYFLFDNYRHYFEDEGETEEYYVPAYYQTPYPQDAEQIVSIPEK